VDELDEDRLHVVITLRPLARILPSRWQQNIQMGHVIAFEDWLHRLLDPGQLDPSRSPGVFWTVHRHDKLVRRWADVLGPDRVTIIVLDDTDRDRVLHAFEAMLGLRSGTLATPVGPSNRSLTLDETEAVRAFNIEAKARGVSEGVALSVMLQGAVPFLKEHDPLPDARRIELPDWAIERTASVQRELVDGIVETGVRVHGDLGLLAQVPRPTGIDQPVPTDGPPRISALMTIGALIGAGIIPEDARAPITTASAGPAAEAAAATGRVGMERTRLGRHRTRILAGALARSVRAMATNRANAVLRRARSTPR